MKAIRNSAMLFAIAALATALGASQASAQDVRGHFTVPFKLTWGKISLSPGNYILTVGRVPGGTNMVAVRPDAQGSSEAFILPQSHGASPTSDKTSLVCIRQGSNGIVRALELSVRGETLYFPMPKGARIYAQEGAGKDHTLLAEAPQLLQRIPVIIER